MRDTEHGLVVVLDALEHRAALLAGGGVMHVMRLRGCGLLLEVEHRAGILLGQAMGGRVVAVLA